MKDKNVNVFKDNHRKCLKEDFAGKKTGHVLQRRKVFLMGEDKHPVLL